MPFHYAGAARANPLTNPALDPISRMPEFKVCAGAGGAAGVRVVVVGYGMAGARLVAELRARDADVEGHRVRRRAAPAVQPDPAVRVLAGKVARGRPDDRRSRRRGVGRAASACR